MDTFFETFLQPAVRGTGLIPAVDVYDRKDVVVIETALPGVDAKNVNITVENGVLTISGSTERKTEVDEKDYYRKEIRSGSFTRQIALPAGVKEENAKASFKDGILKIEMPKLESPKGKSITINVQQ